jgi:hypothetical protein
MEIQLTNPQARTNSRSTGIGGRREHDRAGLKRLYQLLVPRGMLAFDHELPYDGRVRCSQERMRLANAKLHDQLFVPPVIDHDTFLCLADNLEAHRLVQRACRDLRLRHPEPDRGDLEERR